MKTVLVVFLVALVAQGSAFLPSSNKPWNNNKPSSSILAAARSSRQAEQAIQYFNQRFPFDRAPKKESSSLVNLGVPPVARRKRESQGLSKNTKRFTDVDEPTARKAFDELAKVYGPDEALTMVMAYPQALVFSPSRFAPAFDAFAEIFGPEEAKGMVMRNPYLLAVAPAQAATSTEQTMFFSYLVGYTRPIGGLLMAFLAALLSVPVIVGVTGIPKDELFSFLQM